jgi:heme-degrading monooxygenase HmoA
MWWSSRVRPGRIKYWSKNLILEVALLDIKLGKAEEFEQAFARAQNIISSMPGYISHQLQKCLERDHRYILLVQWRRLEDHTEGFRQSSEYQQWKDLLHHFYEPFPEVEHYRTIPENSAL